MLAKELVIYLMQKHLHAANEEINLENNVYFWSSSVFYSLFTCYVEYFVVAEPDYFAGQFTFHTSLNN